MPELADLSLGQHSAIAHHHHALESEAFLQNLRLIGHRRSEALAVMRETLRAYTRSNWRGAGFLRGKVSDEIRGTAVQEHAASAMLVGEWGFLGAAALLGLLFALLHPLRLAGVRLDPEASGRTLLLAFAATLAPALLVLLSPWTGWGDVILLAVASATMVAWLHPRAAWTRSASADSRKSGAVEEEPTDDLTPPAWLSEEHCRRPFLAHVAAFATLTFSMAGVYMLLANYGLVLFTGFLDAYMGLHLDPMLGSEWQSRHPELMGLDANLRLMKAVVLIQMRSPRRG